MIAPILSERAEEVNQDLLHSGVRTPILGMETYFDDAVASLKLPNVKAWTAPGVATASTTHGGFDDDRLTMESIITLIKGGKP
jgi:hypothetical protein